MQRNERIVMVDDLITTGQSVIDAVNAARDQGGVVNELVVLLDREQGGKENLRAQNIEPHVLFNISEAFEWMREVELIDEEHYNVITEYMEAEKISTARETKERD